MNEAKAGTAHAAAPIVRHIGTRIRLAAAFLTILPVAPSAQADSADVAASFGWFPFVGFLIGAALCVIDRALAPVLNPPLRSMIVIAALAAVTGAVHLDGLADAADALSAGRDRARALEILRDSRIGSFGATALIFILTLKMAALATAEPANRDAALMLAPGLGRWAMVAVARGRDYLRPGGAGAGLLAQENGRNLRVATIIALIGVAIFAARHALAAIIVAAMSVWALRALYRRWLGGVTGDLIGAAGEIVETAVLIALSR